MTHPKTFYIRTYGCQMNELDTEIMVGQMELSGYKRTESESEADILLYNTCSIRDLAERKAMGKIGQMSKKKKKQLVGITGCMAQAKKETLFRKLPNVDFVVGTNNITNLPNVIEEVIYTKTKKILTDDRFEENLDYSVAKRDDKIKAYISIIRGCNKYCTYCVVPYTRGTEVSRPMESIIDEAKRLADQGYKEVMLLGQNVNSYGKDQPEWNTLFHDLLYKLDEINGIERVRFLTSHPVDITRELMEATRDLPSLCEFVHFPIQAGSDRILRKMHRIYTKQEYLDKVSLFKEILPSVSLGTDIIVGFPTETEEEFQETCDVFKEIGYSTAFLFSYSARKGTPAKRWKDDIPEEVKQDRLQRLMKLYNAIAQEERTGFLNKNVEVLVEGTTDTGSLKGRTRCWKKVIFKGDAALIGSLQNVKVDGINHQTLIGTLPQ